MRNTPNNHTENGTTDDQPLDPFADGRDRKGKFAPGNPGGPGNPNAKRTAEIRQALLMALTPEDMAIAVRALIEAAKQGDVRAFAELCDRTIGKPIQMDLEDRLAAIEEFIHQRKEGVKS